MASESQRKSSSTGNRDYYDILGVTQRATDEEIRKAYREKALKLHPDKNPNKDTTTEFQDVAKAYKILGDPKLRSTYDLLGSEAANTIDYYEEYPDRFSEMSKCRKFVVILLCCVTGCGFGCGCCCFFCGCCCCCNFCCNRCCGLCKKSDVHVESETQESTTTNYSQESHDSIRRQPKDNINDSTKY